MRSLRDKRSNETNTRCQVALFISLHLFRFFFRLRPFFSAPPRFFLSVRPSFIEPYPIEPFRISWLFNIPGAPFLRLHSREIHVRPSRAWRLGPRRGWFTLHYCVLRTNDDCNSHLELVPLVSATPFGER